VRGVGHEALLRLERRLQACEQVVERVGEQGELVASAVFAQPQAAVQVAGRDVPRRRGDRP
jgi:hypothetical protein